MTQVKKKKKKGSFSFNTAEAAYTICLVKKPYYFAINYNIFY